MLLPPSCSAEEPELGHISKGSSWGSGMSCLGGNDLHPTAALTLAPCPPPSDTDRDPLNKLSVRTCSLHFLCTLLFLFVLVRPSFLPASPSQCPASAVLPLAGPFKLHHHAQEQTPPALGWSKCGTRQRRPQIVKNYLNLNQRHASGLIWGFFVVQCQCKAMANLVFPQGSTSWKNYAFSTWNDQEQSPHQLQSASPAAEWQLLITRNNIQNSPSQTAAEQGNLSPTKTFIWSQSPNQSYTFYPSHTFYPSNTPKLPVCVVMRGSVVETRGKNPPQVDLLVNSYKEMNGNELWDTRTWIAEQITKDKHKQINKE